MCELHRTNPTFEEKHGEQWNYWVGYNPKLAIFVWARGWNDQHRIVIAAFAHRVIYESHQHRVNPLIASHRTSIAARVNTVDKNRIASCCKLKTIAKCSQEILEKI